MSRTTDVKVYEPDTGDNALTKSLEAPKLDPVYLSIANDSLAGKDVSAIAKEYDISPDLVTTVLDKKEVQNYINGVILNQGYLNRSKRLQVINKVIEHKLEEALETGVYSKKDLLDWLKHLNDVETNIKPKKEQGPGVAIQINNYDKLMNDLFEGN